jgi:hypothetical protein
MNCSQVRENLPLFVYGDLQPEEATAVEGHLSNCAVCRREQVELQSVRAALNAVSVPSVRVDLTQLLREATALRASQARRWRRVAIALGSMAAALVIVLMLRLELRLEAHQVVLRWGAGDEEALPQSSVPQPKRGVSAHRDLVFNPALETRLQVMNDTLHALAAYVDEHDLQQRERMERLQARIESVQRQNGQRWSDTERSVAAIYRAMFVLPREGGKQ